MERIKTNLNKTTELKNKPKGKWNSNALHSVTIKRENTSLWNNISTSLTQLHCTHCKFSYKYIKSWCIYQQICSLVKLASPAFLFFTDWMEGNRLCIYSLSSYFLFYLPFQKQTSQLHCGFYWVSFSGSHKLLFHCKILKYFSDFECSNRQLKQICQLIFRKYKAPSSGYQDFRRCLRYPKPTSFSGRKLRQFFDRSPE